MPPRPAWCAARGATAASGASTWPLEGRSSRRRPARPAGPMSATATSPRTRHDRGPDPESGPLSFATSQAGAILAGMVNATSPAFIGRTQQLAQLLELAARASRGGARVLVGGCLQVGDVGLPYVPFMDAFRDVGARPDEAELVAPLVAAVPGLGRLLPAAREDGAEPPPPGDGFEQVQLLDGVLSLLDRLSERAPLVLVIEDVHWADAASRHLLSFLARTLRASRILLVASYRSDELHRRHPLRPLLAELIRIPALERIEVSPFSREELAEYVQSLVGGEVPSGAVDRILARSEGNAFFAEELVAAGAVRAEVLLPDALTDVLLGRIEALPELAREVLKVAAAGRPEAELEQGLREAIAGQFLVTAPTTESYRFRHALLQEVVYGDLLPGER